MKKYLLEFIVLFALSAVVLSLIIMTRDAIRQDDYQPVAIDTEQSTTPSIEVLRQFDLIGDGYHLLYEELALPNTLQQVEPPEITGNLEADKYIRQLAEQRGYVLQRIVSSDELVAVSETQQLQRAAQRDWLELSREAEKEGIELRVVSGHRGIDLQRTLFLGRLTDLGVNIDTIADGGQDSAVNEALRLVAPPGYSRHHTGYTIDVGSGDATVFEFSRGYQWMSQDNYTNTLKHGFIPSYPEGAINQGPEPEPWEFVWVSEPLIEAQVKP